MIISVVAVKAVVVDIDLLPLIMIEWILVVVGLEFVIVSYLLNHDERMIITDYICLFQWWMTTDGGILFFFFLQ